MSALRGMKQRLFWFAPLVLCAAGCVSQSDEGGRQVFQYELWVPLVTVLGGLLAIPVGLVLRGRVARLGWGLLIAGPLLTLVFAPSLFRERVSVGQEGFEVRSGIWGLTATHAIAFADVQEIRITSETTRSRSGRRTSYYLNCDLKNGGSSKVSINNAVTEAAADTILRQASAHRIPIHDATGSR